MCLHTCQSEPYTAEGDITVYKVARMHRGGANKEPRYNAPFYGSRYILNELMSSRLRLVNRKDPIILNDVEDGLHGLLTKKDAFRLARKLRWEYRNSIWKSQYVVLECIIPKLSKYYLGKFNDMDGTASDYLIVKKEIGNASRITNAWNFITNLFRKS